MNVSLPYEIGTVLKNVRDGNEYHDKVHHYIVGHKIQVVLELCYDTNPRLSVPIDMQKLKNEWILCEALSSKN